MKHETESETRAPLRRLLEAAATELSLSLATDQAERLCGLALLLERWAGRMNLTGHRDAAAITRNLIVDALALFQHLPELCVAQRVVDIGSGAGFPGLPLAVLAPSTEVVLVEPRMKRHHFQREACRRIGLENVRPLRGRAEELEPMPADLVLSQALANPDQALAWMSPWARRDGGIVVLTGGATLAWADPPLPERVESRRYRVPLSGAERRLDLVKIA